MMTLIKGSAARWIPGLFALTIAITGVSPAIAGSIFITGHDPDFHANNGPNLSGARNINTTAIDFIMDPLFNPFVGIAPKFIFVESKGTVPSGHDRGVFGVIDSGFALGTDFDHHDFSTLDGALDLLGTPGGYSGIVVASDFGGILRQAELDILNARSADVISFLNSGGGLFAMSESNDRGHLTPLGGHFGFLPFVTSEINLLQEETGYAVTPFGTSLGLTDADVNNNFSHIVFTSTGPLSVVDVDAQGRILSLAGRPDMIPEPNVLLLLLTSFGLFAFFERRRHSQS